jgi:hypothetical protein
MAQELNLDYIGSYQRDARLTTFEMGFHETKALDGKISLHQIR